MLITGCPADWCCLTCSLRYRNWASRSRMLLSFQGLGVGLQTEPLLTQQPAHRRRRHRMARPRQLPGQVPQRLDRPAQRRDRIPALIRLHQRQQRWNQARIQFLS